MISDNEAIARIKKSEGIFRTPDKCPAGYLSIGHGYNLERYGRDPAHIARAKREVCQILGITEAQLERGITEEQADILLRRDYEKVKQTLMNDKKLGPIWEKLDNERQFVLLDMCYNMGIPRVKTFAKMLAALEKGDYQTAAWEIRDSKYHNDVKRRAFDNEACMATGIFEFNTSRRVSRTAVTGNLRKETKDKMEKDTQKYQQVRRKIDEEEKDKTQNQSHQSTGKILNVGDSRTVHMYHTKVRGIPGGLIDAETEGNRWFAEGSKGFAWFKQHLNDIKNRAKDCDAVVINLGCNDVAGQPASVAKKYIEEINKLAREMKAQGKQVYFTSVNPVGNAYKYKNIDAAQLNHDIEIFNQCMKEGLSSDITFIDTNSYFKQKYAGRPQNEVYTPDGLHYQRNVNAEIQRYIEQQVRKAEAARGRTYSAQNDESRSTENKEEKPKTQEPKKQAPQRSEEQKKQAPQKSEKTSAAPANSGNTSDKDDWRILSMLTNLNSVNGKSRQIDIEATFDTLKQKYGPDAAKVLTKAMMAPVTLAKEMGLKDENGNPLQTSREVIAKLCQLEDEQRAEVIAMVSAKRGRSMT